MTAALFSFLVRCPKSGEEDKMGRFKCKTINNQDNYGASAFIFDLRNSTKITRFISFSERLGIHVDT